MAISSSKDYIGAFHNYTSDALRRGKRDDGDV